MTVFRTRVIYPLCLLFQSFAVALSSTWAFFIYVFIKGFFRDDFHLNDDWPSIPGFFIIGYFAVRFVNVAFDLRYGIIMTDDAILLKDYLFWGKKDITEQIKGYSDSFYGYKNDINCLVIYLKDNSHINLPRYMYFNYSLIQPALQNKGIHYLGEETFKDKWLIKRVYRYDNL
jgi:hypothetical protein